MALGVLLLLGAAAIICENRREEAAAGREASAVLERLQAELNAEGAGLLLPEDTANGTASRNPVSRSAESRIIGRAAAGNADIDH